MEVCDIEQGSVSVSDGSLSCNGTGASVTVSSVLLTGRSSVRSVLISNSAVVVVTANVSITTTSSFTVSCSAVPLSVSGESVFVSTAVGASGLGWVGESNVTVEASSVGWPSVSGGSQSAGLGAAANASCGLVRIVNGSVEAVRGTGLGSGWGVNGVFSRLGRLRVMKSLRWGRTLAAGLGLGRVGLGFRRSTPLRSLLGISPRAVHPLVQALEVGLARTAVVLRRLLLLQS
jgi:hypothetical protein